MRRGRRKNREPGKSESRKNMNLESQTVLITGSTDGVGRLVARRLADQGARVLVHGRDRLRGQRLVDDIEAAGHGSAAFLAADFSSLAEVHRLAGAVRQECERLDILINNAGIGSGGSTGDRQVSQDGYELRFAVNYLAGFLITRMLLPLIVLSKAARIVNVSSLGQHPIDFDDVMLTRGYSGSRAYAQSKLAQIMFTFDLARGTRSCGGHGKLPAPCYLHGNNYGAVERRHAAQHPRGRRGSDPQPCDLGRDRWAFWPILQRAAAVEGKRTGL